MICLSKKIFSQNICFLENISRRIYIQSLDLLDDSRRETNLNKKSLSHFHCPHFLTPLANLSLIPKSDQLRDTKCSSNRTLRFRESSVVQQINKQCLRSKTFLVCPKLGRNRVGVVTLTLLFGQSISLVRRSRRFSV